ncbi:MAG: Mur ligase family protein, partial [bacterium]
MQIKKAYPKKTRFVVWGYGVTGQALVKVLAERGYPVVLAENKPESDFAQVADEIARLKKAGVKFIFGGTVDLVKLVSREADVFSPSPGIAVPQNLQNVCTDKKIQIAGEIEIAYRLIQGRIIAITGTDGKTTTATLIHHLLEASGLPSHLVG